MQRHTPYDDAMLMPPLDICQRRLPRTLMVTRRVYWR